MTPKAYFHRTLVVDEIPAVGFCNLTAKLRTLFVYEYAQPNKY